MSKPRHRLRAICYSLIFFFTFLVSTSAFAESPVSKPVKATTQANKAVGKSASQTAQKAKKPIAREQKKKAAEPSKHPSAKASHTSEKKGLKHVRHGKHGEKAGRRKEHGVAGHSAKKGHGGGHGKLPHYAWIAFFILLLLSIAVFPMINEHWWEDNKNKGIITAALSAPVFLYYMVQDWHQLLHPAEEFFSFIVLLWALYTIAGGIVLRGNPRATPTVNTIFLGAGALLANIFGTTGAAMLLIRPVLRTNSERHYKKHIAIFFIFLVANIGGTLTPLGDPPLFLGYLRGVPFTWTLQLWPIYLFELVLLLSIFFVWDTVQYKKETIKDIHEDDEHAIKEPFRIDGKINFLFIAGVMVATLASPYFAKLGGWGSGSPWRELCMIAMGLLSLKFSKAEFRKANHFNFHPIIEVAVLFAGIFITMIPALAWLGTHGSSLGMSKSWHFLWVTGGLSSVLDNAPTYLVFFATAQSMVPQAPIPELAVGNAQFISLLKGISIGAVFMGANTYIGNAPNFMVKVIADTAPGDMKIKMPSFFGYMGYSFLILVPTFLLVSWIFF